MESKSSAPAPGRIGRLKQEVVPIADGGAAKKVGSSFYRGETLNANPYRADYSSPRFLEDYVLKGWLPPVPLLDQGTRITAFGSCFATHITGYLSEIGYNLSKGRDPDVYISTMAEGLVNTFALLGQFEWALENKHQPVNLWHGFKAEGYGYDESIRQRTRDIFLSTEFFIITLGLSEIWYDEVTGGVFWRAVPMAAFDPTRHKFRVSSIAETKANIASIYSLIRRHVPAAKVLFTLSPISLAATFRPVSCITANAASKAILRAGLDEFLRENEADLNTRLFYFPSYEILLNLFADPWKEDNRHPQQYVIDTIMRTFEAAYCRNETTLADANTKFQRHRADNLREMSAIASGATTDEAVGIARAQKRADRKNRRKADRVRDQATDAGSETSAVED